MIAECRVIQRTDPANDPAVLRRAVETPIQVLAPITPHICSELWQRLEHPEALEALAGQRMTNLELQADSVEYPVQVIKGARQDQFAGRLG